MTQLVKEHVDCITKVLQQANYTVTINHPISDRNYQAQNYDVVVLASPVYARKIAQPILNFADSQDFSGVKIKLDKQRIPNILTILRMVMTVILQGITAYFLNLNNEAHLKEAFFCILFINGCIYLSDVMGGRLARKWNACSQLGEYLDSLADLFYMTSQNVLFV